MKGILSSELARLAGGQLAFETDPVRFAPSGHGRLGSCAQHLSAVPVATDEIAVEGELLAGRQGNHPVAQSPVSWATGIRVGRTPAGG